MLYDFKLARLIPHMSTARIECVYATAPLLLAMGSKLLDLSVDLSAAFSQDCPPVSYYRVVLRERVWLRKLLLARGEQAEIGSSIALFSTEPDEPDDGPVARAVRLTTAAIIYHPGMWSGGNQ